MTGANVLWGAGLCSGEQHIVVVPEKGIWGTASIMGSNVDPATAANGHQQVSPGQRQQQQQVHHHG
jgi:hypothetical protein